MRSQARRMTGLLSALLTLAGSESPSGMAGDAEVDLDALARATVAAFEPLASEHEAVLRTGRTEGGTVRADAERLGQALGILVHNALTHGGPSVAVEVGAWREGRTAVLEVRDDGPGIAAADRQRVIERFSRGDPARSSHGGSGLGLAICRAIAEAHGGRLVLGPASSDPARTGLAARIEVPLRRGSAAEQAGA
jgi:signal transduction histidine kinase